VREDLISNSLKKIWDLNLDEDLDEVAEWRYLFKSWSLIAAE
jgi:hypothetical protein